MLQSAYDYLDGEEKITQIDAIMEEDELTKSEKKKLKKVSSQLKKSVKAHDKQSKIIDKAISENAREQAAKMFQKMPKGKIIKTSKGDFKKIDIDKFEKVGKPGRTINSFAMSMIKETGQEIAKKNMDDYKRLNELVKAALMSPISEKKAKPDFLDLDGDGDKEESMKKAAADKKKMDEESTPKYDDDPALKGKQSKLPDGLQKAIIKKKGGKVDEIKERILRELRGR